LSERKREKREGRVEHKNIQSLRYLIYICHYYFQCGIDRPDFVVTKQGGQKNHLGQQ
jgi:hypothetical protein